MKNVILLPFFLLFIFENSQAQNSSEEVEKAIQENYQQMGAAMAAGNAAELALYFTEDAILKFSGAEPLTGRKAIEQAHQQLIDQGIGIRPNTQEVEASGDMAYEIGIYEMMDRNGQTIDQGHYATIWKKEEDQWRIARDIISSTKEEPLQVEITGIPGEKDHLYVELWNPKQAWMVLSAEERQDFFDKVGGEIQNLTKEGIEILGFAVNDEETPYRSDHKYIAVWRMPSKKLVEMLEESVSRAGWYNYFEQVNARGELITPPAALEDMVELK